jgi:hypothetical protein
MKQTELAQRLYESEPDSEQAAALVRDLLDEARYPARLALNNYLAASESPAVEKGMNVLSDLREFSLAPLAESRAMADVGAEVWVLRAMAEGLLEFRRESTSVFKDLLEYRRAMPAPPAIASSELPPGARVCDAAFLLLQRMMGFGTSTSTFFEKPSDQRDTLIRELQSSPSFRAFFESQT